MRKTLRSKLLYISVVVNILLIGAILISQRVSIQENSFQDKYPLLSKRLGVENPNDIIVNLAPLRTQLREYLNNTNKEFSFYFEYLSSGGNIRIGETTDLTAASLLKIPMVMSLYKAVEMGKLSLDQKVTILPGDLSSDFGDLYKRGAGAQITLQEAADLALIKSDNTAVRVIIDQLNEALDPKDQAFYSLDANFTTDEVGGVIKDITVTSGTYSSFFKCLFLSCYLTFEDSQTILEKLTITSFNNLIVAGVTDKNIKIAHKIGSFSENVQSDCGIIYYPKRPYLLCLMVRTDKNTAQPAFRDVSKMVYDYIASVNSNN